MTPTIRIKRAYEPPSRDDGRRVLVDRLWPRGLTKEALAVDAWAVDVAPSAALRAWFGHRADRWAEFRKRYLAELRARPTAWRPLLDAHRRGSVTLVYGARDDVHNHAAVLRDFVEARARSRRSRSKTAAAKSGARTRRTATRGRRGA